MAVVSPVAPALDYRAVDFKLRDITGNLVRLSDIMGPKGAVVAFICNHCPYVIAIAPRMAQAADLLAGEGIGFVAICANDAFTSRWSPDFAALHPGYGILNLL